MKRLPPIVGAAKDISLDYATIFPVENPNQKIRITHSSSAPPPIYWLPGTEVAYAGSSRTINWMPLFFSNINEWRLAAGLNVAELPHPDQIHGGPLSLSISQLSTGPISLISRLYGTKITDVAKNVGDYLDQVLPSRSATILPDGDKVIELVTKPNNNSFRPSSDGDSMTLWNRPANFRIHLRQDEQAVILSTEATEPLFESKIPLNYGQCARIGGNQLIIRGAILDDMWKFIGLKLHDKKEFRLFIENNEKMWITCRLTPKPVDK